MTNEELINQRKKEIADLTSQIDKSKIDYNLPMGSWVSSYKKLEISDRERMTMYKNKHEKDIFDKGFNEGRSYEFSRIVVKLENLPLFDTKGKLENFLDYLREEVENDEL